MGFWFTGSRLYDRPTYLWSHRPVTGANTGTQKSLSSYYSTYYLEIKLENFPTLGTSIKENANPLFFHWNCIVKNFSRSTKSHSDNFAAKWLYLHRYSIKLYQLKYTLPVSQNIEYLETLWHMSYIYTKDVIFYFAGKWCPRREWSSPPDAQRAASDAARRGVLYSSVFLGSPGKCLSNWIIFNFSNCFNEFEESLREGPKRHWRITSNMNFNVLIKVRT